MLPIKKKIIRVLPILQKCKKLHRLGLMGVIPIILSIHTSNIISWSLVSWGMIFLCLFWLEGLALSFKVIREIDDHSKTYNILSILDNIEDENDG